MKAIRLYYFDESILPLQPLERPLHSEQQVLVVLASSPTLSDAQMTTLNEDMQNLEAQLLTLNDQLVQVQQDDLSEVDSLLLKAERYQVLGQL